MTPPLPLSRAASAAPPTDDRQLAALATALAESDPDALLVVSPDGRIVLVNTRFTELWRVSGTSLGDDERVPLSGLMDQVQDPQAFIERVREIYRRRAPSQDDIALRDGRIVERVGVPLTESTAGTYLGYSWRFRDVTESRQAEREQAEVASILQASLLPPRNPEVPGMDVAARFRPAEHHVMGGDFFDVFRLRRNEWGVVLGDVCGRGPRAASLTALARYTVRAAAVHHRMPSGVLRELNAAVRAEPEIGERFCAAVYGRLELDRCGAWMTVSCAGHPRPVVVRRAGWIDVRGQSALPAGLFADPGTTDDRVGLGPGDAIVFCTDGVTEARSTDGELFWEDRMGAVLLDGCGATADEIAQSLLDAATAFSADGIGDDAAVLVVAVPPDALDDADRRLESALGATADDLPLPGYAIGEDDVADPDRRVEPPREARRRLPNDPACVREARQFVSTVLHSWRMSELTGGDAELLTSELAGNVVRHAGSAFEVVLRYDGDRIRVEVRDASAHVPRPRQPAPDDVDGRGLVLIREIAVDWGVDVQPSGKSVWFELPAL